MYADELTMAFVDMRQFRPRDTLLILRQHVQDIHHLDEKTGSAFMATLMSIASAVDAAFPNEWMSLWHSIGPAAFQEVPHLHFHIHPRKMAEIFSAFTRVHLPTQTGQPEMGTQRGFACSCDRRLSQMGRYLELIWKGFSQKMENPSCFDLSFFSLIWGLAAISENVNAE